ncbi:MAG TPA: hypothetical protein VFA78_06140 [Chloroflexota bacterium]|nr:hypothetical protein [Chloroflexota bacterium]
MNRPAKANDVGAWMQHLRPVDQLGPQDQLVPQEQLDVILQPGRLSGRRAAWVNRVTGVLGLISLVIALTIWFVRTNHYRLVLVFLVIAMFAAILHSYTFENGQSDQDD